MFLKTTETKFFLVILAKSVSLSLHLYLPDFLPQDALSILYFDAPFHPSFFLQIFLSSHWNTYPKTLQVFYLQVSTKTDSFLIHTASPAFYPIYFILCILDGRLVFSLCNIGTYLTPEREILTPSFMPPSCCHLPDPIKHVSCTAIFVISMTVFISGF